MLTRTCGMRGLLLGVAFAAQAIGAMAADLGPVNVAPPVAFTWSGFYLGANIGAAFSTIQNNGLGGGNSSSVMGGVSAGYSWQFAPFWVVGVEGDASWADLTIPAGAGDVNFVGTARVRLGWMPTPTTLIYATGGAAWSTVSIPFVDTLPATQTKNGWVAGGGFEWAPWADNWSVRVEYLNYRFTGVLLGLGLSSDITINEGRIGAAYKF
jgi:outer membrane immunogenic protein